MNDTSPNQNSYSVKFYQRKFFISSVIVLLLTIIIGLWAYYFYQKEISDRATDVLTLPGWSGFSTLNRKDNGSFEIVTPENLTEMLVYNTSNFVDINDGSEIQVKMHSVSKTDIKIPKSSSIMLMYTTHELKKNEEALRLKIGYDETQTLEIAFYDLNQPPLERRKLLVNSYGENAIKLKSDQLKIKVLGDGDKERLNFYDGATGDVLVENIQLPTPLTAAKKVLFGLYAQSTESSRSAIMTVDYLKVIRK